MIPKSDSPKYDSLVKLEQASEILVNKLGLHSSKNKLNKTASEIKQKIISFVKEFQASRADLPTQQADVKKELRAIHTKLQEQVGFFKAGDAATVRGKHIKPAIDSSQITPDMQSKLEKLEQLIGYVDQLSSNIDQKQTTYYEKDSVKQDKKDFKEQLIEARAFVRIFHQSSVDKAYTKESNTSEKAVGVVKLFSAVALQEELQKLDPDIIKEADQSVKKDIASIKRQINQLKKNNDNNFENVNKKFESLKNDLVKINNKLEIQRYKSVLDFLPNGYPAGVDQTDLNSMRTMYKQLESIEEFKEPLKNGLKLPLDQRKKYFSSEFTKLIGITDNKTKLGKQLETKVRTELLNKLEEICQNEKINLTENQQNILISGLLKSYSTPLDKFLGAPSAMYENIKNQVRINIDIRKGMNVELIKDQFPFLKAEQTTPFLDKLNAQNPEGTDLKSFFTKFNNLVTPDWNALVGEKISAQKTIINAIEKAVELELNEFAKELTGLQNDLMSNDANAVNSAISKIKQYDGDAALLTALKNNTKKDYVIISSGMKKQAEDALVSSARKQIPPWLLETSEIDELMSAHAEDLALARMPVDSKILNGIGEAKTIEDLNASIKEVKSKGIVLHDEAKLESTSIGFLDMIYDLAKGEIQELRDGTGRSEFIKSRSNDYRSKHPTEASDTLITKFEKGLTEALRNETMNRYDELLESSDDLITSDQDYDEAFNLLNTGHKNYDMLLKVTAEEFEANFTAPSNEVENAFLEKQESLRKSDTHLLNEYINEFSQNFIDLYTDQNGQEPESETIARVESHLSDRLNQLMGTIRKADMEESKKLFDEGKYQKALDVLNSDITEADDLALSSSAEKVVLTNLEIFRPD